MTHAMWGIVLGMALMFGFSLRRYGHSFVLAGRKRGR